MYIQKILLKKSGNNVLEEKMSKNLVVRRDELDRASHHKGNDYKINYKP